MEKTFQVLEFYKILNKLEEYSYTENAKQKFRELTPYLSENRVASALNETSEAKKILESIGTPPLISMKDIGRLLTLSNQGGMLTATELEYVANVLRAIKQLKTFLNRSKDVQVGMAYYADELEDLNDIREEIEKTVDNGYINDYASTTLKDIRRTISILEEKAKNKAESMLGANKEIYAESFISNRGGHICLAVKRKYKARISGSVIDESRTGGTVFIEPTAIAKISEEVRKSKTRGKQ